MARTFKQFYADLLLEVQPEATGERMGLPFEAALNAPDKAVKHRLCLSYAAYQELQQAVALGVLACRTLHVGAALPGKELSVVDGVLLDLSHLVQEDPHDPGTDWMYDADASLRFESVIRTKDANGHWDCQDEIVLAQQPAWLTVQVCVRERYYPLRGEGGDDLGYRVLIRGNLGDRGEWVVDLNTNDLTG